MRVLYVIDSLSPSGAELSLVAMVPGLVARNVSVDVVHIRERDGLRPRLEDAGGRAISLGDPSSRRAAIVRLRRLIRSVRPDLVHTTLFDADVIGRTAARLSGVPAVSSLVNVHYGPEQLADPGLRPTRVRAAQTVDAITARSCVRFHSITEHVANVMAPRLRIRRDLIDVIPRGRDPGMLGERTPRRRADSRTALGVDADCSLILAVARHEHQKGLDVLLEAIPAVIATVPDARVVIAGREGLATPALRRLVTRLDLGRRVRFLGLRTDVPELLCAADVAVMPSRWEGLGGALLEAMALEAPIVASDIAPIREVVTNEESATLVPPEDPVSLSHALIAALKDRDRAARQAERARERFLESFTIDGVAGRMHRFYGRALGAS